VSGPETNTAPTAAILQELETTPLLEVQGLRAAYDRIDALHGVDFDVRGGTILALLGPNGAGKTTTLRCISGTMRPTAGTIRLEGYDVTGAPAEQLARIGVCLIPEGRGIFPNLTVRENILMDTYSARGRSAAQLEEVAFERFGRLAERRSQVAGTLSGGEQQMLALARALTTDPALLLVDELSMGLAPRIVEDLFGIVRELAEEGITTVVVEQFAGTVLGFADHVVVMSQGQVKAHGQPDDVRELLTSAYLGGGAA